MMIHLVIYCLLLVKNSAGQIFTKDVCKLPQICDRVDRLETNDYALQAKPEYLGCFTDDDKRLLGEKELKSSKMTHEMCTDHCSRNNYKFAGVENFKYCFCGNELDMKTYRRALETECNQPCQGDETQFCGGGWRLGVFKVKVLFGQDIGINGVK